MSEQNAQAVTGFRGRALPEAARPAGYAALIESFDLQVPLPLRLTAVAQRHHPASTEAWQLLEPRRAPVDTLAGQLAFALKWEGVDLSVLAALFKTIDGDQVVQVIRAKPTGANSRRLWFLYEWLTGEQLDIPDPGKVRAVPAVDTTKQFALQRGTPSRRHKVLDNLPGNRAFCPLVRRTAILNDYVEREVAELAHDVVHRTDPGVMARAAAFLQLSDSRASFLIEGERPSAKRATCWGSAIGEAGTIALTLAELERLQAIIIGDKSFVRLGLRTEGGFVGVHERHSQRPLPEHIGARPEDLRRLLEGLVAYAQRVTAGGIDAVVAAASMAFGFVYIHPFEDGNGRLHRWLIHHVLAAAGYNPPGVVFPVSAAMLRDIQAYRAVLESYSKPLLAFIDWVATPRGNVAVLNDTADYYRYFDATAHAEYLYRCVGQTVERDLPDEVAYLEAYDRFADAIKAVVDMPDRKVDLLYRFLRQAGGRLSKRARRGEFSSLNDEDARRVEELYAECFDDMATDSAPHAGD